MTNTPENQNEAADEAGQEKPEAPKALSILIEYDPKTGDFKMSHNVAGGDPMALYGLLELAKEQVSRGRLAQEIRAANIRQKIMGSIPAPRIGGRTH